MPSREPETKGSLRTSLTDPVSVGVFELVGGAKPNPVWCRGPVPVPGSQVPARPGRVRPAHNRYREFGAGHATARFLPDGPMGCVRVSVRYDLLTTTCPPAKLRVKILLRSRGFNIGRSAVRISARRQYAYDLPSSTHENTTLNRTPNLPHLTNTSTANLLPSPPITKPFANASLNNQITN